MHREYPDSHFYPDITQLNGAFLQLLAASGEPDTASVLAFRPEWRLALAQLAPVQIEQISAVPCLLMSVGETGCGIPPAGVEDSVAMASAVTAWEVERQLFVAGLLTFLRQLSRQGSQLTRLAGVSSDFARNLETTSLAQLRVLGASGAIGLQVRFAAHPRFWPDLLRSAGSDEPDAVTVSRLSVLPLMVSERLAEFPV